MDTLLQDLRHALRLLTRQRGLTLAALLTLALGIGISTTIFSVVDGVLLTPLPYPEPDRLVRISEHSPGALAPMRTPLLSNLTYEAWDSSKTLEGLGSYSSRAYTWTSEAGATRIRGAALSPTLFGVLRVSPRAGRFFSPEEGREGENRAVVLGHRFWTERFGAAESILGQTMTLDDVAHVVVGIAPPGFTFPTPEAELFTPHVASPVDRPEHGGARRGVRVFEAIGRLRDGITLERAAAEGTAAARSVERPMAAELLFGKGGPPEVRVRPLLDEMTARVKPALLALSAGVCVVLLIGCANVANLLLSAGITRRRELAVRAALGARRGRLSRLLLTESLLLAALGGALGLVIAAWTIDVLPALAPENFPRLDQVQMNLRVAAAGLLAALAAGFVAGIVPAVRGGRTDLARALKEDDGRSAGLAGSTLRSALLVAEAALALVLVVGAGLLVRSVLQLTAVDSGYDPANVLTARLHLAGAAGEPGRRGQFAESVLARVREMPGVVAAGAGNMSPLGDSTAIAGFQLPWAGPDGTPAVARALRHQVTPGYAEALRLRVRDGRTFSGADVTSPRQAMLVNESFVRTYLTDGQPAVGRQFPGLFDEGLVTEIVGVVADVRKDGPEGAVQPEIYLVQQPARPITGPLDLVIRTSGDPLSFARTLREVVQAADRQAAVDRVGTMADRLSGSIAEPRFVATVLSGFGLLALALAAVGLYGALSYAVTRRRRELGVRAALGANRRDLVALVLRQGIGVTAAGLAVGLVLAIPAARLLRGLLFGIEPFDVAAFAAAAVLLLAVAVAASVVPARRAAASDPLEVLRHE